MNGRGRRSLDRDSRRTRQTGKGSRCRTEENRGRRRRRPIAPPDRRDRRKRRAESRHAPGPRDMHPDRATSARQDVRTAAAGRMSGQDRLRQDVRTGQQPPAGCQDKTDGHPPGNVPINISVARATRASSLGEELQLQPSTCETHDKNIAVCASR